MRFRKRKAKEAKGGGVEIKIIMYLSHQHQNHNAANCSTVNPMIMWMHLYKKALLLPLMAGLWIQAGFYAQENPHGNFMGTAVQLVGSVGKRFVPDHRVAVYEISAVPGKDGGVILKGKTSVAGAKSSLLQECRSRKISITDSITLLPDEGLGRARYALARNSVANLRSQPGHASEMATQALLGMPLNLLEKRGEWYRVQTPDDYISWVDEGGIVALDAEKLNQWLREKKIVYTDPFGFSYSKADRHAQTVSDLVAGDVLRCEGKEGEFFAVLYPDGRKAFVPAGSARDYDEWLANADPSPENLVKTAKLLMGFPYLWGGTSMKGVDCSGFMKTVFFLNGVIIQRDASQQVNYGTLLEPGKGYEAFQPGDLLFFGRKAKDNMPERVTHVGMYIGNSRVIHSSGQVRINSLDSKESDYNGALVSILIRGRRYAGNIGKKGIIRVTESPYYQFRKEGNK